MREHHPGRMKAATIFGFCTLAGIVYSSHLYFYHLYQFGWSSRVETIVEPFSDWYLWGLLSFPILSLASRFPFERGRILRALLVHIPGGIIFSIIQVALHSAIDQLLLNRYYYTHEFAGYFVRTFHFDLMVYWGIVVIQNAMARHQQQAVSASQLRTQLAEAQLQALKMQMQPHFLFNTLHAISSLMQTDTKGADQMLSRLSELLRMSLSNDGSQEVSLEKELEFIDKYLEIAKIRFQDRLTVVLNIESETLSAQIPNLILQPLIENSLRHGISEQRGPGLVEIHSVRENGMLRILVRDNGKGMSTSEMQRSEGIGLKNTRARLQQLYGSEYRFELRPVGPEGGFEVSLGIPFHTEPQEQHG